MTEDERARGSREAALLRMYEAYERELASAKLNLDINLRLINEMFDAALPGTEQEADRG